MKAPQFCPHRGCRYHGKERKPVTWYRLWGSYGTKAFGTVQRYRCHGCGRTFSDQTFSLDYYVKKKVSYKRVLEQIISAGGVRDTARQEGYSASVVQNRTARLARQAMAIQETLIRTVKLREHLCADGFESFTVSQYFPDNINLLVGHSSQMVYYANHVTIRRKGRMTVLQKEKREKLEKFYRAPRKGIQKAFEQLMHFTADLMSSSAGKVLLLITDEKKEYPRAIKAVERIISHGGGAGYPLPLHHKTVNSKEPRTRQNDLFAVNYLDRQIRKDSANHVRETVQFARNVNDGMNRLMVYFLQHNFRKPYRIRLEKQDPKTHGEVAGIDPVEIRKELSSLYSERRFYSHLEKISGSGEPGRFMRQLWKRELVTPLKKRKEYCPAYCVA